MAEQWIVEDAPQDNWVVESTPPKTTSLGKRFLQGIKDPIDGGAQLLAHALPDGVEKGINKANNWLADKTGLVSKLPEQGLANMIVGKKTGIDGLIESDAANYHAPEGIDWARLGGNIASPANLAIASKFPQAASLDWRIASGIGAGATLGALAPVQSGDFAEQKMMQIGVGAGLGGVLPVATSGANRLISPKASQNPQLTLLKKEGITPTIGQTLGGVAGKAEEKLQSVPILGDMITLARGQANVQFEAAAHNRALTPIGLKLPDGLSGRDAINFTETALKNKYDDVLTKIGAIKPDAQFNQSLASLQAEAKTLLLPKDKMNDFNRALNEIKNSTDSNGYITSEGYKTLESSLGKDAQILASAQDVSSNKIAPAIKQMQQELKDMLHRQSGQYAEELKATNTGWANFKRVQKSAAALGADDGAFTPAQFQNSVKALDKSKDKGAFARGKALGQDLSDTGKTVLTGKVADSGTTGRAFLGLSALASGALNPAIPAGLVAGGALYTQPMQRLLNATVSSRPQSAKAVGGLIQKSSPYFTPAFLGLLNQP